MNNDWDIVALRDVASVSLSGVDKHIVQGETGVRLCNYLDVYRNRRLHRSIAFAQGTATAGEIARFRLQKGDVLITKDSETPDDIGIPSVVVDDFEDVVCGYHLALVRPTNGLNSSFLCHYLQSETAKRYFLRTATGLTRFGLSARSIASLPVPVPTPEEQAAIARILDTVDKAIELTRKMIERAQSLKTALLVNAFDRLNVEKKRLGEFTTEVRYGTSQAASKQGWGHPTLRIPNVIGDQLALDDLVYVDLNPEEVARLTLRDGDLLMVRTNGNPSYVGRSVVFKAPDDRAWIYASYLIRVRLNEELLSDYVNIFLSMERGRRELFRRVTTSAGNYNINSNNIRLLTIPVPASKAEQEHIVKIAKTCRAYVGGLQRKLAALTDLKKALMRDLLTGKVRVNNLNLAAVANL